MLERIRQLEEQTPEARQAEYEADVAMADSGPWRDTLADYQVASGAAEYVDEDEFGLMRSLDADVAREAPPEYGGAARAIMLSKRFRRVVVRELLMMTHTWDRRRVSVPFG